jgi:RNA-splicing ligase RtcB
MADFVNYMVNTDIATDEQLSAMLASPAFKDEKVRVMPDGHAGKGAVVGTTFTFESGKVVPAAVGVDVCCSVSAFRVPDVDDLAEFDEVVHAQVPAGFNLWGEAVAGFDYGRFMCAKSLDGNESYYDRSIGTLGGGNHFLSLEKGEDGMYMVVHCGSRGLGVAVAEHYQAIAVEEYAGMGLPDELCYVSGKDLSGYIFDVDVCRSWVKLSHKEIYRHVAREMGWPEVPLDHLFVSHNYVDLRDRVVRKGAISAHPGEMGIIPLNMRDGSLVVIGKGNVDWNCSAPHGAGRALSRSQARKRLDLEEYRSEMANVYTSCVDASTIDEAPEAYKDSSAIFAAVKDTVAVVEQLAPVYNFKASGRK